jgi:hypothetical protein
MLSINLPDPEFQRMELVAEPRVEKGGSPSLLQVSSWIELADPQHAQLSTTPVGDDKELEQFLAANNGQYRYDYVRLGCSFCPQNGERFEKAFLSVMLKPDGAPPPEVPISWSIFPLTDFQTGKDTNSAKIGSSAKILSAEIGGSSEIETRQYSVRGFREGKPNPFWELYSNQTVPLEGSLRFHMVVRSAKTSPTIGEVRLEAVISNRSFVVFRKKRPFDQAPSSEFRLPPA